MSSALADDPNAGYINHSPLSDEDEAGYDDDAVEERVSVTWDSADTVDERLSNAGWRTKNLLEKVREGAQIEDQQQHQSEQQNDKKVSFAEGGDGTDEDEDEGEERNVGDDDLFYDPRIDDRNSRWVANMVRSGGSSGKDPKSSVEQAGKSPAPSEVAVKAPASASIVPLNDSDAILSCPSCMTTLCLDSQQHEKFRGQFRAMFVMNVLVANEPSTHLVRSRDLASHGPVCAVSCEICNTEVAVMDEMEVYHFFHVLVSKP